MHATRRAGRENSNSKKEEENSRLGRNTTEDEVDTIGVVGIDCGRGSRRWQAVLGRWWAKCAPRLVQHVWLKRCIKKDDIQKWYTRNKNLHSTPNLHNRCYRYRHLCGKIPCPTSTTVPLLSWQCLAVAGLAVGASLRLCAPGPTLDDVGLVNGLVVVALCGSPLLATLVNNLSLSWSTYRVGHLSQQLRHRLPPRRGRCRPARGSRRPGCCSRRWKTLC